MKKYWKTTVTITVLGEDLCNFSDLADLHYRINEDHFCGGWEEEFEEVSPDECRRLLLSVGNDGEFFEEEDYHADDADPEIYAGNWLERDDVAVELCCIGEGLNGDYNRDDPFDVELLRFTVCKKSEETVPTWTWENYDDGSMCTQLPQSMSNEKKSMAIRLILDRVYDAVHEGASIKKICEEVSWMSLDSLGGD